MITRRSPSLADASRRVLHQRIRRRIAPLVDAGGAYCWRCGQRIARGQAWDLGHRVDVALGGDPYDIAPEHRWRTPSCPGNRAAGGWRSAAAAQRARTRAQRW